MLLSAVAFANPYRHFTAARNNQYVRHGDLDLQKLFAIEDITDRILGTQGQVQDTVIQLDAYMEQREEPQDGIGFHCFSPYSCGFFDYCVRDLPYPGVFDLSGLGHVD